MIADQFHTCSTVDKNHTYFVRNNNTDNMNQQHHQMFKHIEKNFIENYHQNVFRIFLTIFKNWLNLLYKTFIRNK